MKKILIVDDHPKIRELVSVTLADIGDYEILEADTGLKALEICQTDHPDLILLDVMMPQELDGIDVTRKLRGDPKTKDCLIILLTAKGQEADRKIGLEAGADDYFTKPFNPTDLIKKVEQLLK